MTPGLRGSPVPAAAAAAAPAAGPLAPLAALGGGCALALRRSKRGATARQATITASMETEPAVEEEDSVPVKKTSVLVLGATGTVGRQIVRQLLCIASTASLFTCHFNPFQTFSSHGDLHLALHLALKPLKTQAFSGAI